MAGLQQELASIREEQGKLPGLVREVQEALEAEADAFQRQEAGERAAGTRLYLLPGKQRQWARAVEALSRSSPLL